MGPGEDDAVFVVLDGDGGTIDDGPVLGVLSRNDPALVEATLRVRFEEAEAKERERIPHEEALKHGMCRFVWSRAEITEDAWEVHAFCSLHPDETDEGVWLSGSIQPHALVHEADLSGSDAAADPG